LVLLEKLSNLSGRVSSSFPTSPLVPQAAQNIAQPKVFFNKKFFPFLFNFPSARSDLQAIQSFAPNMRKIFSLSCAYKKNKIQ